jgi:HPt (histidine-containing phosphotransfer) domain-containing protein
MTDSADQFPPIAASLALVGDLDFEPAIDIAHLSRMTLGDRKLEREVLTLFDRQAVLLLARMRKAAPDGVATLAHTLKGSALGIGAMRVARAADALEHAVGEPEDQDGALDALAAAVAEARTAIVAMLRDLVFA